MVDQVVPQTHRITRVQLDVAQNQLLVHNLTQYWFGDRVGFCALVVVLNARVVQIGVRVFAVFGLLAKLVERLLTPELRSVLVHHFLMLPRIVILLLLDLEKRCVSSLQHLLLFLFERHANVSKIDNGCFVVSRLVCIAQARLNTDLKNKVVYLFG